MDAPCPQGVEEVMYAPVNELTVAAPADELARDVELDEARQRFEAETSIRCCFGRAHRPRAPSRRGRGATVSGGQPGCVVDSVRNGTAWSPGQDTSAGHINQRLFGRDQIGKYDFNKSEGFTKSCP